MNFQRFTAPTSRQALAMARMAFGEGTLILANRKTDSGVEVIASNDGTAPQIARADSSELPAVSTLSFQDYVRQRMEQARLSGQPTAASAAPNVAPPPAADPPQPESNAPDIRAELNSIRAMIENCFGTLAWLTQSRQSVVQSNWMLKLIHSGFSAELTRRVLQHLPMDSNLEQSRQWVMDALESELDTDSQGPALHELGGIHAFVGSTGVGKTTLLTRLLAQCVAYGGPASVGLICMGQAGGVEQLRLDARALGVAAYPAQDGPALLDLLNLLSEKKTILIDTPGLAASDARTPELLQALELAGAKRLLVLNAGAHGDTLDQVASSFKSGPRQATVLTKTDEAAKLGPVLDVCIRHQLLLHGVSAAQQTQAPWQRIPGRQLLELALQVACNSARDPAIDELAFYYRRLPQPSSARH